MQAGCVLGKAFDAERRMRLTGSDRVGDERLGRAGRAGLGPWVPSVRAAGAHFGNCAFPQLCPSPLVKRFPLELASLTPP